MKTTVGPLPTAVYWRRRAVVLGALLVIVIMLWTACSPSSSTHKSGANTTSLAGSAHSAGPTASSSPSVQIPIIGTVPSSTAAETPPPASGATGQPTATSGAANPTCADTDLLLTAAPETATAQAGVYIRFTLNIKNVSGRPCTRDLGPDHQELYLQNGTERMWSSDVCNPARGSDVVLMAPDIVHSYNNTWNGLPSDAGCAANRAAAKPGKYQLFARLDTKISEPMPVQLT